MRLDLVKRPQHFNIPGSELVRVEGNSGYGIRLGERMVGFSSDAVNRVALKVEDGSLMIRLQAESGETIGSYRIPSAAVLQQNLAGLVESGITIHARERDELVKLMQLSMSGAMSSEEVLLLLDEISHTVPRLPASGAVDAGDLYPQLSTKVRELLQAMPPEIQRFVILNNYHRVPEADWHALHFLSKVDPATDKALIRFLSGLTPYHFEAAAELQAVARRNPLITPKNLPKLSGDIFGQLVKMLAGVEVTGNSRILSFQPALARFIFDKYPMEIPDFTAAPTFEALERKFLNSLRLTTGEQAEIDPLRRVLLGRLDASRYKEAALFLSGDPKARFSVEVREGLRHFFANMPAKTPDAHISSINTRALERVRHFLNSAQPGLLENLAHVPVRQKEHQTPDAALARKFTAMSRSERLGLFLLDHLDPHRHKGLTEFFSGANRLSRMTPALLDALGDLLEQPAFPKQHRGLSGLRLDRFEQLVKILDQKPGLTAPLDYLPRNPVLREAVEDLALPLKSQTATDRGKSAADLKAVAASMENRLKMLPETQRNQLLTNLLDEHLTHFKRVAALDQAWSAQSHLDALIQGKPGRSELRDLINALYGLRDVLAKESEPDIRWDLWQRRAREGKVRDPNPPLVERLVQQSKGLERYLDLDLMLPDDNISLKEKVRELGWVRRIDHFLGRIDERRDDPMRLMRSLNRFRPVLMEMIELLGNEGNQDWTLLAGSPMLKRKIRQFMDFRQSLLAGEKPDPTGLFDGPFLRGELGPSAERMLQAEMKRFEPMFREALLRLGDGEESLFRAVLERAASPAGMDGTEVAARVRTMLENIHEFNQYQNLNNQPLYLSLPLRYGNQQSAMELAAFKVPGKKNDKQRFLVVIHLDFPDWGHLRVDALKDKDSLSATFWVENRKMQNLLMDELHLLEDRLEETGLGETTLNVRLQPERASRPVSELCMPAHEGEVDLQI
ncbi:MAG: flagellar hook-length control protein FliK [Acidobacteriota bacterium]|nr:flagellar hook-length control protein FliK [Acidobacteriota bacterium]